MFFVCDPTSRPLAGLQITLPPREPRSPPTLDGGGASLKFKYPVLINLLQANDAKITLVSQQPGRSPLEFPLHHLQFTDLSSEHPARFTASLTNAVPKGEIEISGVLGPWNVETPRATFLRAEYRLEHADLATINGLQGILSSAVVSLAPWITLASKGPPTRQTSRCAASAIPSPSIRILSQLSTGRTAIPICRGS